MPRNIVDDLLLKAFNSLDLIDLCLLEKLQVFMDDRSNDMP